MLWRSALGASLAVAALAWGTNAGGGLDGPCVGSRWAVSRPDGSSIRSERSLLPPGVRCTVVTREGRAEQKLFPGPVSWLVAVALGAAPFALRRARGARA